MLNKRRLLILCLTVNLFTPIAQANHQAMIQDAWVADAPPVATIRAGYLKLINNGSHAISIKSFRSPDFARVELHKTIVADGMVKMEEVKQLTIEAGDTVEFKPGGYHLMLFNPRKKLKIGDQIKLHVLLKDHMQTIFSAVVRKRGATMEQEHHHHH